MKVFECHAYVHVPIKKGSKLDARSTLCRFLGYSDHEKAYRFEELSSSQILVSRDAQFMEDTFDSGKRVQAHDSKAVKYCDANEATSDEDPTTATTSSEMKAWTSKHPSQHQLMSDLNGSSRIIRVCSRNDRSSSRTSSFRRGTSVICVRTRSKICQIHQ